MKTTHTFCRAFIMYILLLTLNACGGGGGHDADNNPSSEDASSGVQVVSGGGIKGPLANAVVTIYSVDTTKSGFKGSKITAATTNDSAAITGLELPLPLNPPYIMEFTCIEAKTTDITTGQFPVITVLRTVITQELLDGGKNIYATPLTTIAVDIAMANADSNTAPFMGNNNGVISESEFIAALPKAASQVTSTLGVGMGRSVDIFDTPSLVNDSTNTTIEQTNVAAYRIAIETVTAIVFQISQQEVAYTADDVLADLIADLADGGGIDGSIAASSINSATLPILLQEPATLLIPNDPNNRTVADVQTILIEETALTGTLTDTSDLGNDRVIDAVAAIVQIEKNPDIDGDGVSNINDAFPTDPTEFSDVDDDGTGDNADPDDDNDGALDIDDAFPLDPTEISDADNDGTGDNADPDDDNNGILDVDEVAPVKALFIGNSYTSVNNLPNLFVQIAASMDIAVETTMIAPGGFWFQDHAVNDTTISAINADQWDYVFLQNQSQVPGWKPEAVTSSSLPHAQWLVDAIKANKVNTEVIYYVTWGRENGDQENCNYYSLVCTFTGHTQALLDGYGIYQASTGGNLGLVGTAWQAVVNDNDALFVAGELWAADGSHPSIVGSYLAANVLYIAAFKESPVGASIPDAISVDQGAYLQQIATNIMAAQITD